MVPDQSRRGRRKHKRHVTDFLHRKLRDALVNLKNIHTPAPGGACVGYSDRNGEECQLHAHQDQDECYRNDVPGAHGGSLHLRKLWTRFGGIGDASPVPESTATWPWSKEIALLVRIPTERFMPRFR